MGNSTVQLQQIVDYTKTIVELNPVLSQGGFSQEPALTIANDVMTAMLAQPFNPKWNLLRMPVLYSNSWQQDYVTPVTNLSWLETGIILNVNSTANPKNRYDLETNRFLPESSVQYGRPGQCSWLYNKDAIFGTWGGGALQEGAALNPAANSIYGPVLGAGVNAQPANPLNQIVDPNGNFWTLTLAPTFYTVGCKLGATQPSWPTTVQYPTFTNPSIVATTIADGTGTWTAINPNAYAIRVFPIPSQTGVVWQLRAWGQKRPIQFTALSQYLDPIPDDFVPYFRRGFIAYTYMHSKDKQVLAKFATQQKLWMESLMTYIRSGDRERDNDGIYPSESIMSSPYIDYMGPANPYFPGGG